MLQRLKSTFSWLLKLRTEFLLLRDVRTQSLLKTFVASLSFPPLQDPDSQTYYQLQPVQICPEVWRDGEMCSMWRLGLRGWEDHGGGQGEALVQSKNSSLLSFFCGFITISDFSVLIFSCLFLPTIISGWFEKKKLKSALKQKYSSYVTLALTSLLLQLDFSYCSVIFNLYNIFY